MGLAHIKNEDEPEHITYGDCEVVGRGEEVLYRLTSIMRSLVGIRCT
jgi:hypothetical protein